LQPIEDGRETAYFFFLLSKLPRQPIFYKDQPWQPHHITNSQLLFLLNVVAWHLFRRETCCTGRNLRLFLLRHLHLDDLVSTTTTTTTSAKTLRTFPLEALLPTGRKKHKKKTAIMQRFLLFDTQIISKFVQDQK
jgi:hypothetical protein